jgi:hypothetical protein
MSISVPTLEQFVPSVELKVSTDNPAVVGTALRRGEPRVRCKLSLAFLFICLLLASSTGIVQKANAEQNVGAPSPGLALYSPTNTTYTSSVVNCSGVLTIPMGEGGGLSYSIDGMPEGSPPWQLNPNYFCGSVFYVEGSFQLPPLPNGSHCLNLTVEDGSSSWVVTVYFTINSSQPILSMPALSPSPTVNISGLSAALTPSTAPPLASDANKEVYSIPLLAIAILCIVSVLLLAAIISLRRKHTHTKVESVNTLYGERG